MLFPAFFDHLKSLAPTSRVEIEALRDIINTHHHGVGKIEFLYFDDFEGASWGNFLWLEDERSSPHEEPFNDARVFINSQFVDDRPMRRIIAAKELMHVFDGIGQRTDTPDKFRQLLSDIASTPIDVDINSPYWADRAALWKATIALIPPWIRDPYLEQWQAGTVKSHELSVRWWVPENVAAAAMSDYYEKAMLLFGISK